MQKIEDSHKDNINKYLSGELTEGEVRQFETWLKEKENRDLFDEYLRANHFVELSRNNTFNSEKAFEHFLSITSATIQLPLRKRLQPFLKYAAIFIGLISVVLAVYQSRETQDLIVVQDEITLELHDGTIKTILEETQQSIKNEEGLVIGKQQQGKLFYNKLSNDELPTEVAYNTLSVPYGKRIEVVLSDGSIVHLNAGSKLTYPTKFIPGQERHVTLVEGEGYFKVAKNKEDAFIVNSKAMNTKVYGTEFNVSSYENEEQIRIVLVEGSVGVYKTGEQFDAENGIYLKPNEIATYTKSSTTVKVAPVATFEHVSWVEGVMFFENTRFEEILRKLERHYNIEVTNNYTEINSERFTGTFDIENIDDVLNTFRINTFFNYTIKENQLIINP